MTKRNPLTMSIDWKTMHYVCMDVYCVCGDQFHIDVHTGQGKTVEHVQCPHCQRVYSPEASTALVRGEVDFKIDHARPHTFTQWKGTKTHGTAHCDCGTDIDIKRDFAYDVDCPGCKSHFKVEPHVKMRLLTDEEVAALPEGSIVVDDTPEEIAALFRDEPTSGGTDIEPALALATTVMQETRPPASDRRILIIGDVHAGMGRASLLAAMQSFEQVMRSGPPMILLGDFVDEPAIAKPPRMFTPSRALDKKGNHPYGNANNRQNRRRNRRGK